MSLLNLYKLSSLVSKLERQRKNKPLKIPLCLFTDLDDTYILKYWPSEEILDANPQKYTDTILSPDTSMYLPTMQLKSFLDSHDIPCIAVSGRDLYQMNELKNKFIEIIPDHPEIMDFDAIIGAVGTEIYIKQDKSYQKDPAFEQICASSSYNKTKIYSILDQLIPLIRSKFQPVAFDFCKRDKKGSIGEHPPLPYKISYEYKATAESSEKIIELVTETLKQKGFGLVKILWSCPYPIDNTINKYNVDIVPISKDQPITYLKNMLQVRAVVAGDSGNDYDMLAKAADIAVLVGNTKPELLKLMAPLLDTTKDKVLYLKDDMGPYAVLKAVKYLLSDQ